MEVCTMHIRSWIITAPGIFGCIAACSSSESARRSGTEPDVVLPDGAVITQPDADVMGMVINVGPLPDAAPPAVGGGPIPDFHQAFLGPGVTAGDITRFDAAAAGACKGPRIDYPLAGAVMPRNVFPPKIMWTPQHTVQATD